LRFEVPPAHIDPHVFPVSLLPDGKLDKKVASAALVLLSKRFFKGEPVALSCHYGYKGVGAFLAFASKAFGKDALPSLGQYHHQRAEAYALGALKSGNTPTRMALAKVRLYGVAFRVRYRVSTWTHFFCQEY
jgi:hypothetical protein